MGNPYQGPKTQVVGGSLVGFWELLLQAAIGVGYVALQIALMRAIAHYFGNADTDLGRVCSVAATTAASLLLLFLTNRLIFRTHAATLGILAGSDFFSYFYIIHPAGDRIATFLSVLMYWPSLVNMLLAVLGPALAGIVIWLRPNNSFKPKPLRGSA